MQQILKTPQAAAYCGLAASTFEKLRVFGGGPKFIRIGKRAVRYRQEELDLWLAKRETLESTSKGKRGELA